MDKDKVNYFYNVAYNTISGSGTLVGSKFIWGITDTLDLNKPLEEQILGLHDIDREGITNFNITAFNRV